MGLKNPPLIVQQLGLCVTIAGTRDVTQIRLNNKLYPTLKDDVASNLIDITDQGGDAFLAAYRSLSDISSVTEQLSKENGLLDKLVVRMTRAQTEKDFIACQKVIDRIDFYIERSNKNGCETQTDFEKFAALVKQVRGAVTNAQSYGNGKLMDTQRDIELKGKEKILQTGVLKRSEIDAQDATKKYDMLLERYNGRSDWLGNSMAWSLGSSTIGATAVGAAVTIATAATATVATAGVAGVAILGGLLATAVSGKELSIASQSLNIAEDRLDEKRRAFDAIELQLASVEAQLELLKSSKRTLDETSKTIAEILKLLEGLVGDIQELMLRFIDLNGKIKRLIDAYKQGKDATDAIRSSLKDGEEADELDIEDFKEQIVEMRKVCIVIRCFSGLYAHVINDVIIPGFGQVIKSSNVDVLHQNVKQVIEEKKSQTEFYVENSNQKCRALWKKSSALRADELARAKRLEPRSQGGALGR